MKTILFQLFWVALMLAVAGCDDDPETERCASAPLLTSDQGLGLETDCGSVWVLPSVSIEGEWLGGGRDGNCEASDRGVTCPAGEAGAVRALIDEGAVIVAFESARDAVVEGVALEGTARLDGARGWLSNGLQSWSQSGVLALGDAPDEEGHQRALMAQGDSEAMRTGETFSNWYTYVGGDGASLFIGALTADRLRPWMQVWRDDDAIRLRVVSGASGEQVRVRSGATLEGERFRVLLTEDLESASEDYASRLRSRVASGDIEPELGWNSWYDLWAGVDEEAVRANAAQVESVFGEGAARYDRALRVVVDDGWQAAWGDWTPNAKFPLGMDGLAAELSADGFSPGIWIAPLVAHRDSEVLAEHPEWFVEEVIYQHLAVGRLHVLDVTNPEAAMHLAEVIARLVEWGFDLIKIDFLFAGAFEGPRQEEVTGLEAYHIALDIIRVAAGGETTLLAVGAPPLPSFPYVDAWRLGADIAFEPFGPSWFFILNQARSIAARWFLCQRTLCDPDPPLLRALPAAEVLTGAWVVALAGGGVFLSDDLRALSEERLDVLETPSLLETAMSGRPSRPIDVFPSELPATLTNHSIDAFMDRNAHVLPARWATPQGRELVINIGDEPMEVGGEPPATLAPRASTLIDAR